MRSKIWLMIAGLALITALVVPAVSQTPQYLVGTVLSIKDTNSMYVDFGQTNVPGMQGSTLILLSGPVSMRTLLSFQGKQLSFNVLGHDILGRPVCDAYYNGRPLSFYTDLGYYIDYYSDTGYSGYYPYNGYMYSGYYGYSGYY